MSEPAQFDEFAHDYEQGLNQGLAWSGEDSGYYSQGRLAHLARCLARQGMEPQVVLDYGCGVGGATPLIQEMLSPRLVLGVDPSPLSIARAQADHGGEGACFSTLGSTPPSQAVDLAYANGVFHHIPPAKRPRALAYLGQALRPGGLFALWENNPLNPGTRYLMKRLAIDRDAVPLTHWEACRRLERAGFQVLGVDFMFFFIRPLAFLRPLEPGLTWLPLGAQYQVLARRPPQAI